MTFQSNDKNEVVMTVENSAGQMTHKDVKLVDLSGRTTHVPATIHNTLRAASATPAQQRMFETFQRICVSRLKWSFGCVSPLW